MVFGTPLNAMRAHATDSLVCIDNQSGIAWTHPGVTLFLEQTAGMCIGERIVLQDGETGCFDTRQIQYDGSWHLSALDSITAECRSVCPIQSSQIEIQFSVNNGYSCENQQH